MNISEAQGLIAGQTLVSRRADRGLGKDSRRTAGVPNRNRWKTFTMSSSLRLERAQQGKPAENVPSPILDQRHGQEETPYEQVQHLPVYIQHINIVQHTYLRNTYIRT